MRVKLPKKPTIYEIKRNVDSTGSYFFSRDTLKAFNQTLKSFHVTRCDDGRFFINSPSYSRYTGILMGITERYYNPVTFALTSA